ncbi:MAG: hypothetical protein HFI75_00680 [Lachnospiraceae bacterium]|nr:hypothetical protein [Lachnospiraceae bacterium]
MCTFIFQYENGVKHQFEHIKSVRYSGAGKVIVVDEQNLLTHPFPTGKDLHLFSDRSNFTVNGKNLTYIETKKED